MLGSPLPPRRSTRFSGWRIVVLAAIAFGLTGPGQTQGVSVFVDPMLGALDLTRQQISLAYLLGTLAGAFALPRFGRIVDDIGTRAAMALVGGLFGLVLAGMGAVRGIVTLAIGFVGIRMLGQGALALVATNSVAPWFERRRGRAIGVTTAIGLTMLASIPLGASLLIGVVGWRSAWLALAALVWIVVVPIGLFGLIDRPSDVGQQVDGEPPPAVDGPPKAVPGGYTRSRALREPMFWTLVAAVATTGMIGTGLAFHQIDLLGEQGLTPVQAAANFLPQTITALATTLSVGVLVDKVATRWILIGAMGTLLAAMAIVPFVEPGLLAIAYAIALGVSGASIRTLEAGAFPKLFGIRHLGAIRGVAASTMVASTAFGPLAVAFGRDLLGSYAAALRLLMVIPVATAVLAAFARTPPPADEVSDGSRVIG